MSFQTPNMPLEYHSTTEKEATPWLCQLLFACMWFSVSSTYSSRIWDLSKFSVKMISIIQ